MERQLTPDEQLHCIFNRDLPIFVHELVEVSVMGLF